MAGRSELGGCTVISTQGWLSRQPLLFNVVFWYPDHNATGAWCLPVRPDPTLFAQNIICVHQHLFTNIYHYHYDTILSTKFWILRYLHCEVPGERVQTAQMIFSSPHLLFRVSRGRVRTCR